jgi:hypothetical protein
LAFGFSEKTCSETLSKDYYLDNITTSAVVEVAVVEEEVVEFVMVAVVAVAVEVDGCASTTIVPS